MLPSLCRIVAALLRLLMAQPWDWDLHRAGSTNRQGVFPSRCDQIRAMSVAEVTAQTRRRLEWWAGAPVNWAWVEPRASYPSCMVGHRWSILQQNVPIEDKRPKDAMATLHVRAERARGEVRLADVAGNPAPLVVPESVVPFESVAVGLLRKAHPDLAWKAGHRFGLVGVGNESDAFEEVNERLHCPL